MKKNNIFLIFTILSGLSCTASPKLIPPVPEAKKGQIYLEMDKFRTEGDWAYVTGFVRNDSIIPTGWFRVVCNFFDENKNVIDTDSTVSNELLMPKQRKSWEVMQRMHSQRFESVACKLTELDGTYLKKLQQAIDEEIKKKNLKSKK